MENFPVKSNKKTSPHYMNDADIAKKLADDLRMEHLDKGQADSVRYPDKAIFDRDLKQMNPAHAKEVAERAATLVNELRYPNFQQMGRELLKRIDPTNH